MIVYDKLWKIMKAKKITTYRLREYGLCSRTVKRLKSNDNIEMKTLDKLCEILNCNIEDIATYIKTEENYNL